MTRRIPVSWFAMNRQKVIAHCHEVITLMRNIVFEVEQDNDIPVEELVSANKLLVLINKER